MEFLKWALKIDWEIFTEEEKKYLIQNWKDFRENEGVEL